MNPALTTLLDDIEAKAKEIQGWKSTTDLKVAADRFDKLHDFYDTGITLALVSALRVAREALQLVAGPSNFNCEIGEGNQRAAANAALTHIDELFEKEK